VETSRLCILHLANGVYAFVDLPDNASVAQALWHWAPAGGTSKTVILLTRNGPGHEEVGQLYAAGTVGLRALGFGLGFGRP
jgi:hypothetical protein